MVAGPIKRALVTGGAGFIGSHVVDRLAVDGAEIVIYDNFSSGRQQFIAHHLTNPRVAVVRADVNDLSELQRAMEGCDFVFHMQANADVRGGQSRTRVDLEQNVIATWNVMEAMRVVGAKAIAFASSATVYGEPGVVPTPETYAALQTSLYGASKIAGEATIQAFCEYFDIQSWIFRFVSWIGPRYTHGVIFDFVKKLITDGANLDILGDGRQTKSYLDVSDGISGIFTAIASARGQKNIFNLGHSQTMNVLELADLVVQEMGLTGVNYRVLGGQRGWLGDSPYVHLDTTRLNDLGWGPKIPIERGVRGTVRYLLANPGLLQDDRS